MPAKLISPRVTPVFYFEGDMLWFEHDCTHEHKRYTLPSSIWKIISREPLTVTPSVSCQICHTYGFIIADEWVST